MATSRHNQPGLWAILALSVSLLAAASLGSTGGFSVSTWNGYVNYDTSRLRFGIVDAHNGFLGTTHCSASGAMNPNFAGAANRLETQGHQRHAFWFLTSLYHGQNTCGWTGSAYDWGQAQAQMFTDAIQLSGYTGNIDLVFGDVEYTGTTCATDLARWWCNNATTNRQVVKGFDDHMSYLDPGNNGVYSSGSHWIDITNQATASDVGAPYFWFAYYGASQAQLNYTAAALQGWGFYLASWQYTTDQLGDGCVMTHATAESQAFQAFNSGYYVLRFDGWDNDQVIQTIDQVPNECD